MPPVWWGDDASIGVSQGYKTYFLQDEDGQMNDTHSIAAGLDYVGVSPILSDLKVKGRVRFIAATDEEVMNALTLLVLPNIILMAATILSGVVLRSRVPLCVH